MDIDVASNEMIIFSMKTTDLEQARSNMDERLEPRSRRVDKRDDGKEYDAEIAVVKDNALFEAVPLASFAFKNCGFDFGIVVVVDLGKAVVWMEEKCEKGIEKGERGRGFFGHD